MTTPPPATRQPPSLKGFVFVTALVFGWPLLVAINILVWKLALSL